MASSFKWDSTDEPRKTERKYRSALLAALINWYHRDSSRESSKGRVFEMTENHVCPVWIGYLLASPLRRLVQNPDRILAPFVLPSMTVMDVGSAMGFFSLSMAKLVGPSGRVICVDLQEKMLAGLRKRAQKAGVADRIKPWVCSADGLGIDDLSNQIDFALAFAVVHEVPRAKRLFEEILSSLRHNGTLLFAEPKGHVNSERFQKSLNLAREVGYAVLAGPKVARSHTSILKKQ